MRAVEALRRAEGTWKLIWFGETKISGAGTPFRVTVVPAREVGRTELSATAVEAARLLPLMATIIPAAMEGWTRRLAALRTPELSKVGCWARAAEAASASVAKTRIKGT